MKQTFNDWHTETRVPGEEGKIVTFLTKYTSESGMRLYGYKIVFFDQEFPPELLNVPVTVTISDEEERPDGVQHRIVIDITRREES